MAVCAFIHPQPTLPNLWACICSTSLLIIISQNANCGDWFGEFYMFYYLLLYWCLNWNKRHIQQSSLWTGLSSLLLFKLSQREKWNIGQLIIISIIIRLLVKEVSSVIGCHLVQLVIIHVGWQSTISRKVGGNSTSPCSHGWCQPDSNLVLHGS